jgi:hypothetical protein
MELAIIAGIVLLLLMIRWFNRSLEYMVKGVTTLTREAERFEREEK